MAAGGSRSATALEQPVIKIYDAYKEGKEVQIWLVENTVTRLEGRILGFDEYMNIVLEDAVEVDVRRKLRTPLGRLLLKGDNITLISVPDAESD